MKKQCYTNQKFQTVKPEDVNATTVYAFTLSPVDQPLQTNLGKIQLAAVRQWSEKLFTNIRRLSNCTINANLEISGGGRLHIHGLIRIDNIACFYFHDIPLLKSYGTYEIDTIKDPEVWQQYMIKQKSFMAPWCAKEDISYDYVNQKSILFLPSKESLAQSGGKNKIKI